MKTISSILKAQLGLHQIESIQDPLSKSLFEDQSASAMPSDLPSLVWANALTGLPALNGRGTGASTASVIQFPIAISHDETRVSEADGSSIPFGTASHNSSFGQLFSAPTAAPTPNLTISWGGATQSQPGNSNPPDCNIAAGTNNIITVVNNHIDIYSKAGVDLSSQSLNTFFNQPASNFIFDPRVIWDQFSGRFIVTAGDNTTGAIHLAVSTDSNPLNGWYQYNFPFGVDVDQPLIGLDSSTVYISGEYDGPNYFLIALDRNTVEAGNAVTPYAYTWESLGAPSADRYVPAHMFGSHVGFNGDFMLEYVQNFGNDTLRVIEVGNAASLSPTHNIQSLNLGNISDTALQGARQPGTAITINDGNGFAYSGKIDNAVWRADKLYAVNEIRVGSGANAHEVVHWFVVDTSNLNSLSLLGQGSIDYGSDYDTYYGNLTVDVSGNMIIGYSFSGPGTPGDPNRGPVYASSVYAVITAGGTGLQDSGFFLRAGEGINTNADTRPGYPPGARWGDYSGIAIDPTDEKSFWVFNEYATSSNSWASTVGGFQVPSPGSVSINDVSIAEGNSGTNVMTFTVTRSGGTAAFAVNYFTSDGGATVADNDYVANSGTLNFGTNVNTQTISVTINGDTKFESDEAFFVNLSAATNGATVSDNLGIGTITNDDPAPAGSISINDVSISEGDSGTKIETFTVTRSGGTAAFAVNFATSDNTATTADHDYAANAGTLNFGTGVNTQTISITINGDTTFEPNETFLVNLSAATNGATISDSQGIGTIQNDDLNPSHFDAAGIWTPAGNGSDNTWHVGDFNGDGKDDIFRYLGGEDVFLSNGISFTHSGIWSPAGNGSDNQWHVGDFNGDGKDDIFRYLGGTAGADMFLSNGASFVHNGSWSPAGTGSDGTWHVGDFNGDGKADIFRYLNGEDVFLSDGTSFVHSGVWSPAGNGSDGKWYVGDFNGDGKDDIFRQIEGSGAQMFLSTGTSLVSSGVWTPAGMGSDGTWHVGDFNGDGKADIFRYLSGQSGADVFLSTGSSFVHDASWTGAGIGTDNQWYVGDFNGHGADDIFRQLSGVDMFLSHFG